MKNKKIALFEKHINKIKSSGYVNSVSNMKNNYGIEISLPQNISPIQANNIANYIKTTYNLTAYFYAKKHGIDVYYND